MTKKSDEFKKPWDGFNGTKNEWAWFTLKEYDLPSSMEYDDIDEEFKIRELLKTKTELEQERKKSAKLVSALVYIDAARDKDCIKEGCKCCHDTAHFALKEYKK